MKTEARVGVLAVLTTGLTLLLGAVDGMNADDHRSLLLAQTRRTGDYVDYAVARRLEPVAVPDPEFLLAKELVLAESEREMEALIRLTARRGWAGTGIMLSIVLVQGCIVLLTAGFERTSPVVAWAEPLLLGLSAFLTAASVLWLFTI